jgi:hypothetical protein
MDKKHLKFISIPDAMEEIKTTLLMQSEFKKREELVNHSGFDGDSIV